MTGLAMAKRARALGTYVELAVTADRALAPAQDMLSAELQALDLACSRFRPESELSRANAQAGSWVPAGPILRDAVEVALAVAEDTEGLVDPTLGQYVIAAGYDRDFMSLPNEGPASPESAGEPLPDSHGFVPENPCWREVRVDNDAQRLFVPRGCLLDLGATAKARAADRVAADIASTLDVGVLVSLGGDVSTAGPTPPGGWPVRVNVGAPGFDDDGETVMLSGGAVATSSPVARRWRRGGADQHHIIDPRTGRPAELEWLAVSVVANNCVVANAATTATVILGQRGRRWLAGTGLAARLVGTDGVVHRIGGWPAPREWS
jgi:thiamine biosynthesis lipoprotein